MMFSATWMAQGGPTGSCAGVGLEARHHRPRKMAQQIKTSSKPFDLLY